MRRAASSCQRSKLTRALQASRLRELRLSAMERRQRRRRRRRLASSAVPTADGAEGGGAASGEGAARPTAAKPLHVVEVVEPGGEVDLGVTSAESDAEGGAGDDAAATPTPAAAPRAPEERIDAEQPVLDAAAPPPRAPAAALGVEPPAAQSTQNAAAVERPTAHQSARALLLIARVRRAFDGLGDAMRARRAARREREAAASEAGAASPLPDAASPRLRASATVGEDGAVRITIARAP